MFELINSIASALPQAATVVAGYKAAKPFLDKLLGPAADELGEAGRDRVKQWRAKNGAKTVEQAEKRLADADIEPQSVPLKMLVPLLEAASLEDDDVLQGAWASLLANAANPQAKSRAHVAFVEIMRQISPIEVRILTALFPEDRGSVHTATNRFTQDTEYIREQVGSDITRTDFHIAFDNLVRLRLCTASGMVSFQEAIRKAVLAGTGTMDPALSMGEGTANIGVTMLGIAFLQACTPPQAVSE